MSQYGGTKFETFKAQTRRQNPNLQHTREYNENKVRGREREKNPRKILGAILAKSFSVYMNGVMETNCCGRRVAVLCFSGVSVWRAHHCMAKLDIGPNVGL